MVVRQRSVTSHNGHQVPPLAQARKNKYSGGNNEYDSDNITLQGISMYLSVMQESHIHSLEKWIWRVDLNT